MLRSFEDLENYAINATDGEVGQLKDLYFGDDDWVVRYLVVDTGTWHSSNEVLISPISFHDANWPDKILNLSVTQAQVRDSPNIDTKLPVSRQNETQYLGYYGYEPYWGGMGTWGAGLYPYDMSPIYAGQRVDREQRERDEEAALHAERVLHRNDDPHLRSCQAVTGYHLHAKDGDIGHVAGYLIDDATWAIRYLIVDTSNWWLGHKTLVAPQWITGVDWSTETVSVDMTRESIKTAPVYAPNIPWRREMDRALYLHHGRPGPWAGVAELSGAD
jgi:hypothetical protein